MTTTTLITDNDSLISATSRFGHTIPTYDDGFGSLFILRNSMGIYGIVRARTWEDAYSICEDEFFPEAEESIEEIRAEYNFKREHVKLLTNTLGSIWEATPDDYLPGGGFPPGVQFYKWETRETPSEDENGWTENELFQGAYGFRPNGCNARDTLKHGIYLKDLNGDSLEPLTPALLEALEITLTIEKGERD